ncbi:hypothetical protein TW65_00189 [Stemphylium lycopersici]|nr:hypothetical protein TW65_00189 [Stemphylium lycopersici]
MAPALGKRKRVTRAELEQPSRSPSPSSGSDDESEGEHLQAIFRRAFEAKFKPLPTEPKKPRIEETMVQEEEEEEEEAEEEEGSDWSGISDAENDVQVIEYHDPRRELDDAERAAKKAFMSSKPPSSASTTTTSTLSTRKSKKEDADADGTEATNLKNDLALQKLLRESHLLSASSSGTSTPSTLTATGVDRHKSMDLHLQSLGAKHSVFTQKKMPMAQRKHMVTKARTTEEKRRAEAREAGIVLEKESRAPKKVEKKRERGVGGPSIGKFRGGTLSLSKQDVRSITGGGGGGAKGKGKGGKKGKR